MQLTNTRIHMIARMTIAATVVYSLSVSNPLKAEVVSPVLAINEEAAKGPVTAQALRRDLSVLTGSGGNIGVLVNADGTLLVDAGIAVSKNMIQAALTSIGATPIRFVIDTHYHWDHTDGNQWAQESGATIIAHENTQLRLKTGTRVIEWGYFFPAAPAGGLPTAIVRDEKTMQFGGETIVMKHHGAGHTDTDLSVYFKKADVLHVGDIWWNGHYPFIDNGAGGSIDGVIQWTNECIKDAGANTLIIPGHGAVGNRAELIAYRDMLVAIRENVARLKKSGKTLAETIAAKPTAAYDEKFGDFLINPAFFTQLVYMGV